MVDSLANVVGGFGHEAFEVLQEIGAIEGTATYQCTLVCFNGQHNAPAIPHR